MKVFRKQYRWDRQSYFKHLRQQRVLYFQQRKSTTLSCAISRLRSSTHMLYTPRPYKYEYIRRLTNWPYYVDWLPRDKGTLPKGTKLPVIWLSNKKKLGIILIRDQYDNFIWQKVFKLSYPTSQPGAYLRWRVQRALFQNFCYDTRWSFVCIIKQKPGFAHPPTLTLDQIQAAKTLRTNSLSIVSTRAHGTRTLKKWARRKRRFQRIRARRLDNAR